MSSLVRVYVKTKTIEFINLNDDCNYEINNPPMNNSSTTDIRIIDSLNYILWSLSNLKILVRYNLINWDIYSNNDLEMEIIKYYTNEINVDHYLKFIELKYKTITDALVDKLGILRFTKNFDRILHTRCQQSKNFYLTNTNFLINFKFTIDLYNANDVLKYINKSILLKEFIPILPLPMFERLLHQITIEGDLIECIFISIAQRFANYAHEKNNIIDVLFATQELSFDFIKRGHWTFNNWKSILQYQNFSDEQLLNIINNNQYGLTLVQLICTYRKLPTSFIENNLKSLDMRIVSRYQPLTYEFAKRFHTYLDFSELLKNTNISFSIVEVNDGGILNGLQYVITKNINACSDVVFID